MLDTQPDSESALASSWAEPCSTMMSPNCYNMTPSPDSTMTPPPISPTMPHLEQQPCNTHVHHMMTSFASRNSFRHTSLGRPLKRALKLRGKQKKPCRCVVCGERASGMYFGAMVCLPCKSFFIRCTKDGQPQLTCLGDKTCSIDRTNRMRCQYCRYQKCLRAGMMRREKPEVVEPGEGQELCRVCADIANGIHFGVMTCEGCKKFFRRALKEAETYECKFQSRCTLNPRTRNVCRLCRYNKCLNVGMSRQAIRMGRPKKIKTEPSSFYDGSFAFDQCSALFNNSLHMMQQSSISPMTTMTPFGLCCPDQKCTDPKCTAGHPRSPSGTDSGFESDGGVSGMHSPVSLQAPHNLGASPTLQSTPTDFSTKPRQVPFNGMPFPNACFDQSTVPTIKTEPVDVYECNSMYGQSPTNTSYQSSMADCSQMFQQSSSPMCATEVSLTKDESDNVAEEVDLDDINDILCTLGQFLDSSENQSKPKPEQYNQQCAVSSQNGNIYHKSQNSSYGQCTQNIHGEYIAQNTSTQYPYCGTQYQSAMQSYPQSSMQNSYQGQQWSSTQQPMTTGSQSGYYSYSNMSGVPYTC